MTHKHTHTDKKKKCILELNSGIESEIQTIKFSFSLVKIFNPMHLISNHANIDSVGTIPTQFPMVQDSTHMNAGMYKKLFLVIYCI